MEATKKHLKSNDSVLDYGCGPGTITTEFSKNVKTICAIDISSGMISVAKGKADECHIENVEFVQSTLFDERHRKESFNVILAFNILHYLDDSKHVMQRIHDLLVPGGLFISATACLGERMTFLRLLMFFLTRIGIVPTMKVFKMSELHHLVVNGNFTIVETEKLSRLPDYFIVSRKISQ